MKTMLCGLLFLSSALYAEEYYVSYSSGNDVTGNGSQALPWKTTRKVKGITTFTSTDRIYFKRGDVWQSEIDCESYTYYIGNQSNKQYAYLFSSYGSGNQPVLPRIGFYGTQSGYRFSDLKFKYKGKNACVHSCSIYQIGDKNIQFNNCTFENDNCGDSVLVYQSDNIKFVNCTINGGNQAGLTLNDADNCTVEYCLLSGFVNGLLCYQGSKNNTIRYNKCYSVS